MTWTDAQQHCRERFDDLATVESLEELNRLIMSTNGFIYDVNQMWIGLYDDLTRWQWSHGNQDYIMDQHYFNWSPNEPNFNQAQQNCTFMKPVTGKWIDYQCDAKMGSVCFNDEGNNYTYVPKLVTWYEAKQHCQSHHTELASVSDATENGKIVALLGSDAWIGLHRDPYSLWSDGSRDTYRNWIKGQPANFDGLQHCVTMEFSTAGYRDKSCDELSYVACQGRPKQRSTFRLKINSDADMMDPDVQRQVDEQLYAKLAKEGVTGVKLNWVLKDSQDQQRKK
ncbi:hypothetical protein NHX12_023276 [Muraenolepis orangiensis]|uniref:C-type lectin domain-containing protein n=1 Tax=Muraenolepis orangiensis TaxID=630683 RepID=A0A9Q0EMS6_9TELE|nr:hypothetical protein NHX12_023276 [Muraenolepis orangiensis]